MELKNPFNRRPAEDHEAGVNTDFALPFVVGLNQRREALDRHSAALVETLKYPEEHLNRLLLAGGVAGVMLLATAIRLKYNS